MNISARKAAIVLLALDKHEAAQVMKALSNDCLEKITAAIWTLGDVDSEEKTEALTELTVRMKSNPVVGGEDKALALLKEVVGNEQAEKIILKAKKAEDERKAFRALLDIKSIDLANFLSKEQPSTIGVILGFLPATKVSEILKLFEEDLRTDVIIRLASPTPANQNTVKRIEKVFIREVVEKIKINKEKEKEREIGGPKMIAEILQFSENELSKEMLEAIQDNSAEMAAEISAQLFTFEDIIHLSSSDMQRIMRDAAMEILPIALRGVESELMGKFTDNLSKRAKENLLEEMDLMGKMKKSEVKRKQKEIVTIIRALEAAGEITIPRGSQEDDYV